MTGLRDTLKTQAVLTAAYGSQCSTEGGTTVSQSVVKKQHPGVFALPADTLCNNVSWIQHEEALPTLENDIRTTTFPDAPYIKKKPMFCLIYVKKHQAIKSEIFTGHKYLGCDV